jgi:hypothetical protein
MFKYTFIVMMLTMVSSAQVNVPVFGNWKFFGSMEPPTTTYAALPSAATSSGKVYAVTDGNGDCTAGGGSKDCWFRSNGTAWACIGCDGAGTGGGGGGSGIISCIDTGGDDTYSTACSPAPTAWVDGLTFWLEVTTTNSADSSLDPDGPGPLTARAILTEVNIPLVDGMIGTGGKNLLYYDASSNNLRLAFSAHWLPDPTGMQFATINTVDGFSPLYNFKQFCHSSGVQSLPTNATAINPNRECIEVNPTAARTLSATPTIPDGEGGQKLRIQNVSLAFPVILQDETALPASNICIGSGVTIPAPGVQTFIWQNTLLCWAKDGVGGTGGAPADGAQSANTVKAGPTSGGAAAPAYRVLERADMPVNTFRSYIVGAMPVNETVAAGTTRWFTLAGGVGSTTVTRFTSFSSGGTLSNLSVSTSSTNTSSGAVVCVLETTSGVALGLPAQITVTIPASAVAGAFVDNTNTALISNDARVRVSCTAPAGGASATINGTAIIFSF